MSADEPSGFVDGPVGPIAWSRIGSGPPLVLINGYAATRDDWHPTFLEALGRSSTVFSPDIRGIGGSGGGPDGLSVEAMADDAIAFLDAMSIESADLVAWSMGGFIAQTVASAAPERVASLVLMATDPGGPEAVRHDETVHARLLDHSGSGAERAERLLGLLFPPEVARAIYTEFGENVAAAQEQLPLEMLRAQEAAMDEWYLTPARERLTGIEAAVLVATGTLDEVIPPANAALLGERLPASWLARFPGGGHAFMAQEPLRLAATINAFTGR